MHKGKVKQAELNSGDLHPEFVELLAKAIEGSEYSGEAITRSLESFKNEYPFMENELHQLTCWLVDQIS